ncbi:MAG: glucose/galactose transporter [Myxococcaceae bacterium]|nr:glucose/galactose transporter [Myxococcaceae bacterium]
MDTSEPSKLDAGHNYKPALAVLTTLFFTWGLITSLNDILVPHLQAIFTLSYFEAMLVQFAFFGAYFVTSVPWGKLVERVGYRTGLLCGLIGAGIGCLGFYPAAALQSYALFLVALFVLASGICLLQVAANPFVAALGPEATAASRLNLTQAFNALGTTVGPLLGAALLLSRASHGAAGVQHDVHAVQGPYLMLAATLGLIALLFSRFKLPQLGREGDAEQEAAEPVVGSVLRQRHVALGVLAIFAYVGAEVSIGSFLVAYMVQPEIAGFSEATAGHHLSFYWGGAMVGRFIGSAVLQKVNPGWALSGVATIAVSLLALAMSSSGALALWSVLAIGMFNSIMFPTIFSLALARLGKRSGEASGYLCMAIVGGAIVPLVMGFFADRSSVQAALFVPAVCYAYVMYYGARGRAHAPG